MGALIGPEGSMRLLQRGRSTTSPGPDCCLANGGIDRQWRAAFLSRFPPVLLPHLPLSLCMFEPVRSRSGERSPPPQVQRVGQFLPIVGRGHLAEQPMESQGVHVVGFDVELVSAVSGPNCIGAEQASKPPCSAD